ncbi:MAG: RimJ/RimL family protein N-acetyltransferase [Glaciecola sp.]|jgi:RimJ/RimL family protein N-acetyltransferase
MTEKPFPIRAPYRVETRRLVLRPYAPGDSQPLQETTARCKPHLVEFMPWARFDPQTLDEKLELILSFRSQFDAKDNYIYGIFDAETECLIGGTGLHPRLEGGAFELGYWVTPEAEGNGFASEAVRALCHVGFDHMQLDLLGIRMEAPNLRSVTIASKLGFVREGVLRKSIRFADDRPKDAVRYTMIESEYRAAPWRAETCESVHAFDALNRPLLFSPSPLG